MSGTRKRTRTGSPEAIVARDCLQCASHYSEQLLHAWSAVMLVAWNGGKDIGDWLLKEVYATPLPNKQPPLLHRRTAEAPRCRFLLMY